MSDDYGTALVQRSEDIAGEDFDNAFMRSTWHDWMRELANDDDIVNIVSHVIRWRAGITADPYELDRAILRMRKAYIFDTRKEYDDRAERQLAEEDI